MNERPPLDSNLSPEAFRDFYWLKAELQQFCREAGLRMSGGKVEISDRIAHFLEKGERGEGSNRSSTTKRSLPTDQPLTLETTIHEGFKCGQRERAFFESVIGPNFRFTVRLQKFIKANVGATYADIVAAWYEQEAQKKSGAFRTEIAPQFEYNRFIRAYFDDPANDGATLDDATRLWKAVRSEPGPNVYDAAANR